MKDEYGRKIQCPKCGSLKISHIKDSGNLPSGLIYCEKCGKIGTLKMFRALPMTKENPSRRDSELEDPTEPILTNASVLKQEGNIWYAKQQGIWSHLSENGKNMKKALKEKKSCFIYGECACCHEFQTCAFLRKLRRIKK